MTEKPNEWRAQFAKMRGASEAECLKTIKAEMRGRRRTNLVLRWYSRYSKIRRERELNEILGGYDGKGKKQAA
jgi:hypothetical protein